MSRVTSLFGARDHDNFLDRDDYQEERDQQQQSAWDAQTMGTANGGKGTQAKPGGISDELAKIKAELDAAVMKEKPISADPSLKPSPKLASRTLPKEKAFESSPPSFPAAGAFASATLASPRPTDQRDPSPIPGAAARASSRSAKKSSRKKSADEGDGAFGEFPQTQEAFGAFPAAPSNGFGSSTSGGFGDFGGWPEASKSSPRPTFSSPQSSPPLANATGMAEETLDALPASRATGSMAEPVRLHSYEDRDGDGERSQKASATSAAPGQFDEAILAALAALPQQSLVDVLRRLAQRRPNEVAIALGPGGPSTRSQDIKAVVQSALPSKADRGGTALLPPAAPSPGQASSSPCLAPREAIAATSSPALGFASPMPEEASPMPLDARSPSQPEGSPWQQTQGAPGSAAQAGGLFRVTSAPAAAPQRVSSGPGPWGPPVQSAAAVLGGPWTPPVEQAGAIPEETPPAGASPLPTGSAAPKPWPSASTSPWG